MKTVTPITSLTSKEYADLKEEVLGCLTLIRGCEKSLIVLKTALDDHQIDTHLAENETEEAFLLRIANYLNDREHEALRSEERERIQALMPDNDPKPQSWLGSALSKLAKAIG